MLFKIFVTIFFALNYGADVTGAEYVKADAISLRQGLNGLEGKLWLLRDGRLDNSVQRELWNKGDWSLALPPESTLYKSFLAAPPKNAKLEVTDATGKLVTERDLERPLASLEEMKVNSPRAPLYLLTVDYSAEMGSYNGPRTFLIEVSNSKIKDVVAAGATTRRKSSIILVKSLKSSWQPSADGDDLFSISCHARGDGFVIDYIRYHFDGARWLRYSRHKEGLWEADQPFPPRSTFP